jgi:uncharacterized protein with HEPN domain
MSDRVKNWTIYVRDMVEFINNVESYTQGFTKSSFKNSRITYDATVRNIELIGEAASKVPTEIQTRYTNIPWRLLIATRNRLIHGYFGIDADILWDIVSNDLTSLKDELRILLEEA